MKMDVSAIVELVKQTPQVQQAVDIIDAQLERMPIMPEDLDEMISMLEAVVQDPNRYPEVRAAAIEDGIISEQEAPQEYDPTFVLAVLVALYGYRERLTSKGYARGGLKVAGRQLEAAGRGGDSMLAHINPREAEMLRRMGGAGTINPNTGLREYKSGKGLLGAILPIALNFIVPGIGGMIGTALGATGVAAKVLGSAIIGGVSSAVTGGDPLRGAVMGGLGSGLGSAVGSTASNTLGLNLGSTAQNVLGGALVGGAAGALTGQGFGQGALQGAVGSGLSQMAGGMSGPSAFQQGLSAAGKTAGQALTAGYDPKSAAVMGGLSGLASGVQAKFQSPTTSSGTGLKPSDQVVEKIKFGSTNVKPGVDADMTRIGTTNYMSGEQGLIPGRAPQLYGSSNAPGMERLAVMPGDTITFRPEVSGSGLTGSGVALGTQSSSPLSMLNIKDIGVKDVAALALASSMAGSRPPAVNDAIKAMSPEQQEYFNRPSVKWDWNKLQSDANAQNMSLSQYMSTYWPQVSSGIYNMAMGGMYAAGGGPLGAVARLVRGGGSGRDDTINARLSDGEYVMDAETVAMLGDGSTDEGARRLDSMRSQLRKHKGKTLARGKFSPNAKSPLAYLKGAA
jgi:hypothetical protein